MITMERVSLRYAKGDPWALREVDLDVTRGEFCFVVGESGSGKSSLLRLVILEQRPSSGRVLVAGHDLGELAARRVHLLRRQIGTVFQDFRLLSGKTVDQNVAYVLQVLGAGRHEIRQRVPETLALVGLEGKGRRLPHELSGGEQQRVAIARAMVNKPPILLADEPTGNLDPDTSQEIVAILDRINRAGTTVLMATHDTTIVDQFRKRVVQLRDGEVVRDQAEGGYRQVVAP
ncbi:Cell division transporter, ATP-binding protein FtsE [Serinicoccus hydrothermalis]|uniref:Cell division ATP-binding protein FtsE n=2 Tax=Serinicoccus hydrothermalis TaxID=1758689 RepID=A0A1B1NGN4_9MICO|nr:cell division ATP-binding protein FtsE [Serinicoccus hydrothermalis]ANS80579.1 Cell division transporter, ATP-binding protein FtsE [Serinicoccus hydrothermalis]